MFGLSYWPQLAAILQEDEAPYTLLTSRQLEAACATGDRGLCGRDLLTARLDMALAGLMAEFGPDFFADDIFPSRFAAVREILTAARVFLEPPRPELPGQEERVRLLCAEAETVLMQWNQLIAREEGQTRLAAAEDPAELT